MHQREAVRVHRVDQEQWTQVAGAFADYNHEQVYEYAIASAARVDASARFYVLEDASRILGAACVRVRTIPLLGCGVAYVAGGPLVHVRDEAGNDERYRAVLTALKRELVDHEGNILIVRLPLAPPPSADLETVFTSIGFAATRRVRSYRTIAVDLTRDTDALLAGLAGKWRTDLRYAQKAGLNIEHGSDEAMCGRFLSLFGEMHDAKNFDVNFDPRILLDLPAASIGLEILIATKDGKDAAGHALTMLGDTAVYQFGATNELGRASKAGYLLNWQSMLTAKELGFSTYDLGGIDPDANPGGYRFKNRMGGQDVTAAGPYEARPAGAAAFLLDRLLALRGRIKKA